MLRARPATRSLALALALGIGTPVVSGCAGQPLRAPLSFRYFETPDPNDAWTPQIASWQARERLLADTELLRPAPDPAGGDAAVSGPGGDAVGAQAKARSDLRSGYFAYRAERKRELARGFAEWLQREAKAHYIPDGPVDHWATLKETLDRNGDDCDGLELLTFHFLLDLGFRPDEVFRAIVVRPSDGQHHMVTLWFEDAQDPWVIDPTGAMTTGMPRLSEVPGWAPLKLFGESTEYTVRPGLPLSPTVATLGR
jgi:hypothetical protein